MAECRTMVPQPRESDRLAPALRRAFGRADQVPGDLLQLLARLTRVAGDTRH